MIPAPYTYLAVNIFTILFPLIFSFEKRLNFYKRWKLIFPVLLVTATFFIVWDHMFTQWNVWHFNPDFVIGLYIGQLPIEEYLFFLTVPYASFFVYESFKFGISLNESKKISLGIVILISFIFFAIFIGNPTKLYTATVSILIIIFLFISYWFLKFKDFLHLLLVYLLLLFPFSIVNGILTGGIIDRPVVLYNDSENLGIRLGTIPLDDFFYSFLMLLMNISMYDWLSNYKKLCKTDNN